MWRNLSHLHRDTAERYGPNVALRYKRNGLFRDLTWAEYRQAADQVAFGLLQFGIAPGDRIGLLSENRAEWLIADIAILAVGAVNVPIHFSSSATQAAYQLAHSEARAIFLSDNAQADKIFDSIDQLPNLELLISFEPITQRKTRLSLKTWDSLRHLATASDEIRRQVEARESLQTLNDIATIMYTSGTTGNPKGVMLSHGNLLSNAKASIEVGDVGSRDILMSWLPYSHIYARTCDHYQTIFSGSQMALAESPETLVADLKQVRPTWITAVPRFYEKIWSMVEKETKEIQHRILADIFGPRMRFLCSGGAPLPNHVCKGFHEAGFLLIEGYGLTECSPVISFNRLDNFRIGTVGQALRGTEIRIAGDGEIQVRSPSVMLGYWKNDLATAESIVDGWLNTGDIGSLDEDGFLAITDRKKELIVLSNGKKVMPSEIERMLVCDTAIDQAIVFGDRRPFLTAIIIPNPSELIGIAKRRGSAVESEGEFLSSTEINDEFLLRIAPWMEDLCGWEKVRKVLVLNRPLSIDAGELTATLKVRRRAISEKFAKQIARLYDDNEAIGIDHESRRVPNC